MRISIIIPCFNEAETIREIVERAKLAPLPIGWQREIIIVDDGSDADTKSALATLHAPQVQILTLEANTGKGAAVKHGLRHASGDYILIQDADLEYDPNDYEKLVQPIIDGHATSVFGSRTLRNNNIPYSAVYFYGGLAVTHVFNLLFRTRLTDIATCYKLFPRERVASLLQSSHSDFVFDAVDLTHELITHTSVIEVPISYVARTKRTGKKLSWRHGIEIIMAIFITRLGVPAPRRASTNKALRFIVSGGTAAFVHVVLLFMLTEFAHIWYVISSALAFTGAFVVNFVLQKFWVFRSYELHKAKTQLPLHLSVALINLGVNLVILYALVEYAGVWYVLAQIIASIIVAFESYFVSRWIFR